MSINVRFQIVLLFAVTLAVLLISSIHQRHIQSVEDGYLKETLNRELLFLRESILMETHVQSLSKYFSNVSGDIDKLQQLFQSKSNLYPDTHFVILNEKGEILLDLSNRDHAILKNLLKPLNEQFVTRLLVNRTLKITSIQQNHYAFSLLPLSPSDRFLAKPFRPVMDHRYVLMAYRQYTPSYLWHLSWQKSDIAFFVCTLLLLLVFFGLHVNQQMQPIQDMALKLKNIIKTQKFDEHMDCKIQGEVKHLADAFNQTLAYLRQSVVKRDQLILEIANRVKIEQKLKQYQNQLEKLVNERTLALEKTNQKLITEIEERKVAEHARRELSRKLLLAYEDERKRLARELHDGIGPSLLCIKLELQQLQVIKQVNLQPVIGHIANTVDDLRAMTKGLRPAFCEGLPLTDMLMEYNHYFESISGMSIQCTIQLPCILPDNVEEHLFRIYQEALNNCSKHAKSSEIYISLSHCGQRLLMTIRDNGEGIEEYRLKEVQGLGMFTMKERAALLGGEFSFTSQPTVGSTIRVEIPLPC